MNVNDVFAKVEPAELTSATWADLLVRRRDTFRGFAAVEDRRGFVQPKVSFSTSHGQETLRIMMFRVLEESAESYDSRSDDHYKEEAIDALNYLFSAVMLDEIYFGPETLAPFLLTICEEVFNEKKLGELSEPLSIEDLGLFTQIIGGKLADTFRARAWMNNEQNPYFEGADEMRLVLREVGGRLLRCFESWEEFHRFFMAKELVLRFRLESQY